MSTEDRLISNDCDGEAFCADSDGSVWIGTSDGLAHYRPRSGPPGEPRADPVITALKTAGDRELYGLNSPRSTTNTNN